MIIPMGSMIFALMRLAGYMNSLPVSLDGALILLIALADSSFLTMPEANDLLIVVLSTGKPWNTMLFYVFLTITGSLLGCVLLYTVGRRGGSPLLRLRFSESAIQRVQRLYEKYGALSVAIPSILPPPCPFKIFVLSAGVFRLNSTKFILAIAVGRTIRYLTWGILAVVYGAPVKLFIQTNLLKVGTAFFASLILVATIMVMAYLRHRRRKRERA